MRVCVYVYRNISGTTLSISIKFDMHIYFWILNSKKRVIFLFPQLVYVQLLIIEKHCFAFFFQSSHRYKQFR
ncbi:hypothetical protein TSAR_003929 [Trichomalopsis sarcophagae]|uniref:Uncharacterized protein n=1 Tax=Trichomalopsis sarcophagae TaxID=543379 RepID=A0A232EYY3_9HYME|nr:hypothetical protein TSAR_003929 [Trichomalopsis sarcophagae]